MEYWNITVETVLTTMEYRELSLDQMRRVIAELEKEGLGHVTEFRVWRHRPVVEMDIDRNQRKGGY